MMYKKKYKKWLIIWAACSLILIISNKLFKLIGDADIGLILGCLSIAISILSLGFSDLTKRKFSGILTVKVLDESVNPGGQIGQVFNKLNFHLVNTCGYAVNNFAVTFRFPNKIYLESNKTKEHYSFFRYGETVLATTDVLKFIGSSSGYNDVVFEHYINLQNWNKGHVMITVSGDNVEPKTYVLRQEELEEFKTKRIKTLKEYSPTKNTLQ